MTATHENLLGEDFINMLTQTKKTTAALKSVSEKPKPAQKRTYGNLGKRKWDKGTTSPTSTPAAPTKEGAAQKKPYQGKKPYFKKK